MAKSDLPHHEEDDLGFYKGLILFLVTVWVTLVWFPTWADIVGLVWTFVVLIWFFNYLNNRVK